jgi:predicted amidohydrolase YtcJ
LVAGHLLIVEAELGGHGPLDVQIRAGKIARIARRIRPARDEVILEASNGALLPGLHDHHLHLLALAAAFESVPCGPPAVRDRPSLVTALRRAAASALPGGWVRGIGYHESVAGPLDRDLLDTMVDDRPLRIQHRSGQLWVFNTMGAKMSGLTDNSGRLLHGDRWLGEQRTMPTPDLEPVGKLLASFGVTGVSDASVSNGPEEAALLRGSMIQDVLVMGDDRLGEGPRKIMLHDDQFPALDDLIALISNAHRRGRVVAIHCVTRASLLYALAAFGEAGAVAGDRIEHGSVIPAEIVPTLADLGLIIVTQPNFVTERGDEYLREVQADDQPLLYRIRSLIRSGVGVAGGTDAPFGHPDPWRAMKAAVERRTASGAVIGPDERVTPEQALGLFSGSSRSPSHTRQLRPGATADLCLLTLPWQEARCELSSELVKATLRDGGIVHTQ